MPRIYVCVCMTLSSGETYNATYIYMCVCMTLSSGETYNATYIYVCVYDPV